MKTYYRKAIAIAILIGIVPLLHEFLQFRAWMNTTGTITRVGERACCSFDGLENLPVGFSRVAVKMTYKDGDIEREVDLEYPISNRWHRSGAPNAVVGAQVPIVYVSGKPWLTTVFVNRASSGWSAFMIVFFAFAAWIGWRGNEHPLIVWLSSFRKKET
jgi:hypothetical protein